jgi:hypothetical protein
MGSNIFMQLITTSGPVVGECLLDGYWGSIELKDFNWGMQALKDSTPNASGGLGGLGAVKAPCSAWARSSACSSSR